MNITFLTNFSRSLCESRSYLSTILSKIVAKIKGATSQVFSSSAATAQVEREVKPQEVSEDSCPNICSLEIFDNKATLTVNFSEFFSKFTIDDVRQYVKDIERMDISILKDGKLEKVTTAEPLSSIVSENVDNPNIGNSFSQNFGLCVRAYFQTQVPAGQFYVSSADTTMVPIIINLDDRTTTIKTDFRVLDCVNRGSPPKFIQVSSTFEWDSSNVTMRGEPFGPME